ncbi:MarR family winged helix-turn-helix transcriptional regulator [Sporolactobacillus sp. KGMB 08714]|uniref:MarR family winged helix-turn-helix transcriptional regulator n=1 Tax=Sporolactobacillus sp. KGMB 08714 TaxID=3064704 RepID=UPI002FBDB00D
MIRKCTEADELFYRLHLVSKEIDRSFEKLTCTSLTKLEILFHIHLLGEITQTLLIDRIKLDAAAVTRHLKRMEAEELVNRKRESKGKSLMMLTLTKKGQQELIRLERVKEQFQNQLLADLTNEQIIATSQFIEHISQRIRSKDHANTK